MGPSCYSNKGLELIEKDDPICIGIETRDDKDTGTQSHDKIS